MDICIMLFPREKYYTITDILKKYKISRITQNKAILDHQIPKVDKHVNLGEYSVNASYFIKEDIDALATKLGWQLR